MAIFIAFDVRLVKRIMCVKGLLEASFMLSIWSDGAI